MDLTKEQKQQVERWVGEGLSLSDVQRRIQEEFGVKLTYMDTRFLVDELAIPLAEPEDKPDVAEVVQDLESVEGGDDSSSPSGVSVEVDTVTRPGAMVSGSARFSDGGKAGWMVDQYGRLGLVPETEGYQPPAEDIAEFQAALQDELRKMGMA